MLEIAATYDSVGYHGKQEKPERIEDTRMRFVTRRDGDALVLESRERSMMHHAFVLNRVDLALPDGVALQLELISSSALEGRHVEESR
ncbi:MAG: hypothetical protein JNN30_02625 [Rhodanobacteraceae bacterium]|nr:hypothetical protein [Rhodanobacteraceae bacterium]